MKVLLSVKHPLKVSADLVLVFVSSKWKEEIALLGKEVVKSLNEIAFAENFSAKEKQTVTVDNPQNLTQRILLWGVGDEKEIKVYELQNIIGQAMQGVKNLKRKKIAVVLNSSWFKLFQSDSLGRVVAESLHLSVYSFDKYKGQDEKKEKVSIEQASIIVHPGKLTSFEKGVNLGKLFADATVFARELVNEPAANMTPTHLAQVAQEIGQKNSIKVTIYEEEDSRKLGMNAFLGVGQGSDTPAKFIKLHYKPSPAVKNKIVLVGKGITFDTGGLSLKPGNAMETMKIDMAGAAAVLGVFSKIAQVKPNVEIVGLIAACENMPSGRALRPGDILTALNGKTIEVLNTDAEGRLTLADALSYAVKYEKPSAIVDLATLTGAMMAALGEEITGFFGNDEDLINKVKKAGAVSGELLWQIPLYNRYKEQIKSDIADVRNTAKSKYGGAISAALFLEQFVASVPWVHLDIAGPAFSEKPIPLCSYGGTGFGVRFLLTLLENF